MRGTIFKLGAALLVAAATMSSAGPASVKAEAPVGGRPNILLVITDDQRSGHNAMSAVRRKIVEYGTSYSNAFATTPSCCPSRASMFTGMYSHNHGVIDNGSAAQLDTDSTLQFHLNQAGYRTAIIGKYLNKWWKIPELNPPANFDKYAVIRGGNGGYYYGGGWVVDGEEVMVNDYSTTFIEETALDQIGSWDRRKDKKPWLLLLTPPAPHGPSITLPKYEKAEVPNYLPVVEEDKSDKPLYVQKTLSRPWQGNRMQKAERRALLPVDDMVGRVLKRLKERGELSNTLVIYVSDNAVMWEEHGLPNKGVPYTESVKVPLFLRWDGWLTPGSVDDRLVGNIDIAPTILDAAGVDDGVIQQMDGKTLLNTSWVRDRLLLEYLSRHRRSGKWSATRTHDYQYTEYYGDLGQIEFREYYDLAIDPLQLVNLLQDGDPLNDPTTLLLEQELAQDRSCAGSDCP